VPRSNSLEHAQIGAYLDVGHMMLAGVWRKQGLAVFRADEKTAIQDLGSQGSGSAAVPGARRTARL
jgi:hypothetical protein